MKSTRRDETEGWFHRDPSRNVLSQLLNNCVPVTPLVGVWGTYSVPRIRVGGRTEGTGNNLRNSESQLVDVKPHVLLSPTKDDGLIPFRKTSTSSLPVRSTSLVTS